VKRIALILALLILCGCRAYIDETRPAVFIPRFSEESIPKGYAFDGNTVTYKLSDSTIKIRYMEPSDIDLFFLRYNLANPFIGADNLRDNLTLFLLTFVNNETKPIRFDPRRASIYVGGRYYRGSLDYTEIVVAFQKLELGDDDAAVFKKTMYDLELDIAPGRTVEGLLAFPFIPKKTKKIVIMLSGVYIGDKDFGIPFEFEEK
jgi:hypothetical protein